MSNLPRLFATNSSEQLLFLREIFFYPELDIVSSVRFVGRTDLQTDDLLERLRKRISRDLKKGDDLIRVGFFLVLFNFDFDLVVKPHFE